MKKMSEIESVKMMKRDAEVNWKRIMDNPERCKIEYWVIGEAMGRLNMVDEKMIKMGILERGLR